jgi:hypothetical protein
VYGLADAGWLLDVIPFSGKNTPLRDQIIAGIPLWKYVYLFVCVLLVVGGVCVLICVYWWCLFVGGGVWLYVSWLHICVRYVVVRKFLSMPLVVSFYF